MNYFFITGTSRGIGKALAEVLLEDGNTRVFGVSRGQSIEHPNYTHITLDLSNLEEVKKLPFDLAENAKRLVVVNNAGVLGEVDHLGNLSDNAIEQTLNANLVAPMLMINRFLSKAKDHPAEKLVVNISSGAATSPYDGWSIYNTSKAGLEMLTRVGDKEQALKENGVRFLSIAPGVVETAMQEQIRATDASGFSQKQKFLHLKENDQLYTTEDVARRLKDIIYNPYQIEGVTHRIRL